MGKDSLLVRSRAPTLARVKKKNSSWNFIWSRMIDQLSALFITKIHQCLFLYFFVKHPNEQRVKNIVETMLWPSSLRKITNELKPLRDGLVLRESNLWFQSKDLNGFSTWHWWTPHRDLWWQRGRTATWGGRGNQRPEQRKPLKFKVTKGAA